MSPDPTDHRSLDTRPSLLFRLRDWQDAASWEEFYRLYHKLVLSLALRSGLPPPEAEEVTQDVFKRVAETIHEFESNPARGSFRGWLMNLTRWRITDKFRELIRAGRLLAPRSEPGDDDRTSTIERVPDPAASAGLAFDAACEGEWQRHLLEAALARIAQRFPARHLQAFDLSTNQGWSVLRISRELNLNPATVYVIRHRLRKQLKQEIDLLRGRLV